MELTHGSLFTGIGGFDLAAQWAGIKNIWQVEIDEYCLKVLQKNFPETKKYKDIYECKNLEKVDIISGGFECQPFSIAGKQRGVKDVRWVWPEMLRIIKETRPSWVIGENTPNIAKMALDEICNELENENYSVQAFDIPAGAVNSPQYRYRTWFVANSNKIRCRKPKKKQVLSRRATTKFCSWWQREPNLDRVANGLPNQLDRLEGLGNAIVPQIAYIFFKCIKEIEINEQRRI